MTALTPRLPQAHMRRPRSTLADRFNRQLHPVERTSIDRRKEAYAKQNGLALAQAEQELLTQANLMVRNGSPGQWNERAARFLRELSTRMRFAPVLFTNVGGALSSSALNGENPNGAMGGAAVGTAIGYPIGSKVEGKLHDVLNPWYRQEWVDVGMGVSKYVPPSTIPSWVGGLGSGVIQEGAGAAVQNNADDAGKK